MIDTRLPQKTESMPQLIQTFEELSERHTVADRLLHEEKKLLIIQCVAHKLQVYPVEHVKEAHAAIRPVFKTGLYCALLAAGLFENLATSYFFGSSLFALIPTLSSVALMIASMAYALCEGVLFYFFDVSPLNELIGVPYTKAYPSRLIAVYAEQLDLMRLINQQLSGMVMLTLDNALYEQYMLFARSCIHDLRAKYPTLRMFEETVFKKMLKASIFVFGAISSIAGNYFMAMSMLTAPLVGTMFGWLLVALIVTFGLGFHYVMGATSMARVVNPDDAPYHALKKKWADFLEKQSDALNLIQVTKQRVEKKCSTDACTQTDPAPESSAQRRVFPFFSPSAIALDTIEGEDQGASLCLF